MIDLRKMNGESEIPKKLYLLDSEIDSVHKNVEILIAILEPLLRPMPVSDSRDCEKDKASSITVLGSEIQGEINTVRKIRERLEALIGSLEV